MPSITLSSKASRARYSSSARPGAVPCTAMRCANPASARARNSTASSTAAPASPTENRGRIGRLDARAEGAALRNLDGGGDGLRQVGKQRRHLGAGLEPVLGRELWPLVVGDQATLGDADQRVMRLVIFLRREQRLVGRYQRNAARVGELDQRGFRHPLGRDAVALQLDIEAIAEQACQRLAAAAGERALPGDDRGIERAAGAAGERNQPLGLAFEPSQLDVRRFVRRRFEKGTRIEPHQAAVAVLACGQQHDARTLGRLPATTATDTRAGLLVAEIDRQRAADDRLDADACHFLGKLERPEHVVGVGERERRLSVGLRQLG